MQTTSPTAPQPNPTVALSRKIEAAPSPSSRAVATMQVGGERLEVQPAEGVRVKRQSYDAVRLDVALSLEEGPESLTIRFEPGEVKVVAHAGAVTARGADGEVLAAIPIPDLRDETGESIAVELAAAEGVASILVKPDQSSPGTVSMQLWVGRDLIDRVEEREEEGTATYSVIRTEFGHELLRGGIGATSARELFEELGWAQAVSKKPVLQKTPSLRQQFDCHVLGAPTKVRWNLEANRPDFPGWLMTALRHRCNWT